MSLLIVPNSKYEAEGTLQGSVSQTLLLADPYWLRKITTELISLLTGIYFVRMIGIQNRKFKLKTYFR